MSYGRLVTILNNVAEHAHAAGLKRGDTVAVFVADAVLHLVLTLGLMRMGIVTISPGMFTVPGEIPVTASLLDVGQDSSAGQPIFANRQWMAGNGKAPPENPDEHDDVNVTRVVLTSGTTGQPKGVALTHDLLARRVGTFSFAFGNRIPRCSRCFVDVGLSSNYGLQWIVWQLSRGGAVFFRGTDAAETLQAFELYQVQFMVAAPSGLAEFVELYEQSPDFACPFDVILAGGSLMWKSLADRVRKRMCSHLVTSYGASEFSPIAVAPYHQVSEIKGAAGYVVAGAIVQAVDDADRPLPPGETGAIRMRGDFGVDGYVGNPPGSEQAFRNGWFYPGDLGAVTADNVLVISGRQASVLNVGGNKMGAESVEQVMHAFPAVEQAGVFSVDNEFGIAEVWAALVAAPDLDEGELHRHCRALLPHQFVPRRFLRMPALPRNPNGKLDRQRLADLAAPAGAPAKTADS
jgi:fatty-acyl-CoA synthase